MEKVSKNICIQKGNFTINDSSGGRLSKVATKQLHDLNSDCLRAIFQHLDLATQFSLIKSFNYFFNIIVFDIWYGYDKKIFDIAKDQSMEMLTKNFQVEFLALILQNFPTVKGISLEIFQRCMKQSVVKDFSQTISLSIRNTKKTFREKHILELNEFHRFPSLEDLHLENITIGCNNKNYFSTLKSLYLKNISIVNDFENAFLNCLFSNSLQKYTVLSLPEIHISFKSFTEIYKCVQLKELTLSFPYLCEPIIVDYILNLPSLQILTLASNDNFDLSSRNHTICYEILKKYSQSPHKFIRGLHLNGMPEKFFYLSHYLEDVTTLNWTVRKFFHCKSDGSVEWKTSSSNVLNSFNNFLANNKYLEHIIVRDNIFYRQRTINRKDFEEKIHELRKSKGYKRLTVVYDYKQINGSGENLCDLAEGSIRFFIENRK